MIEGLKNDIKRIKQEQIDSNNGKHNYFYNFINPYFVYEKMIQK